MREIARQIHVGGERAEHSGKGSVVGDVSIGRYREILNIIPKGSVVLDVACGNGYGSSLIAKTAKKVIGVDLSESAIKKAQQFYQGNMDFKIGSATKIPVAANSVDVLISIATIEHVLEDSKFVSEAHRVLKPGGRYVFYTPQNRLGKIPTWPWHEREYSIEQLENLLRTRMHVDKIWGWQNGQVTEQDPRGDGMFVFGHKPHE